MRHKGHPAKSGFRDHNPLIGIGIFFIALGLALLVASNDLLNLGEFSKYFTWETALIFIGMLLLLNLKFTGGILFLAAGTWFLLDDIMTVVPDMVKTVYWPVVLILIGLSFIASSIVKRIKSGNSNIQ